MHSIVTRKNELNYPFIAYDIGTRWLASDNKLLDWCSEKEPAWWLGILPSLFLHLRPV